MLEAAGFVLYARTPEGMRYLLLRNARHGTWSFPKGHVEEGEDLQAAARRELEEETGITDIEVLPDFHATISYTVDDPPRKGPKRTHLFLARAEGTTWTRSGEHDEGGWLPPETALARLQHADLKDTLLRAMSHVAAADPASRGGVDSGSEDR